MDDYMDPHLLEGYCDDCQQNPCIFINKEHSTVKDKPLAPLTSEQNGEFVQSLERMAARIHENAVNKGFWNGTPCTSCGTPAPRNKGESLALIHSEISELLEEERVHDSQSEKIPNHTKREEEAADALIRLLDYCHAYNLKLGHAAIAKAIFNTTRPHMHNKKC